MYLFTLENITTAIYDDFHTSHVEAYWKKDNCLFWYGDAYVVQSYQRKWTREYVEQHNFHAVDYELYWIARGRRHAQ